ncbi:hypothetical protein C8R48DRAFT_808614, partial [Suillus tomentosus]
MLIRVFDSAYINDVHPTIKLIQVRVAEILPGKRGVFPSNTLGEVSTSVGGFFTRRPKTRWRYLEQSLNKGDALREKSGGEWVMGDTFSYANIIVASRLFW